MRTGIVAVLAILALAAAAPAKAQRAALSGGSNANAPQMSGGGGGGGGGFGGGHALPQLPQPVHYTNVSAHGTEADFQLTSFVPYEQAVRMGEEASVQPTKTLGQIAAEYRAAKLNRSSGQ